MIAIDIQVLSDKLMRQPVGSAIFIAEDDQGAALGSFTWKRLQIIITMMNTGILQILSWLPKAKGVASDVR